MKPVEQTKVHAPHEGINGNCFASCLASMMELPIEAIPQFEEYMGDPVVWSMATNWLRYYGLKVTRHTTPPQGFSIATGPSPRWSEHHCCIVHNGKMVHDPHPAKSGLSSIEYFLTLDPV